jgi:Tol biopolymer transport system component
MKIRCAAAMVAISALMLVGSCGGSESTPPVLAPAGTQAAATPTATVPPLTDTPVPPSMTPADTETPSPTATDPPPAATETPVLTATNPAPTATATRASLPASAAAATPEGRILYSVYPEGDIAVTSADGNDLRLLIDQTMSDNLFSDRLAAWRPGGKQISYAVDDFEQAEIWIMDSGGGSEQRLVTDVASITSHSWSPDGTRIAFVSSQHELCILDVAGEKTTELTGEGLSDVRDPDWSPDGSQLAFSASDGRNQDIYVVQVDGSGLARLTNHEARDKHPDWSPDGTKIAFSSTRRSQRFPDIYLLDLRSGTEEEGNMPLQLTAEDALEIRPDWSPDGSWIVYLSHELGAEHGTIFALYVDRQVRVQVTADNVYHSPRWQP